MTVINTLLEITIYSAVLLGAILLFRLLLKKRISPAIRYAAWFLIVARLLMPVTVASGFSLIVIPSAPSTAQLQNAGISALPGDEAVQTGDATAASDAPAFDTAADVAAPHHASAATSSEPAAGKPTPFTWKWDNALLGLWLGGAAFVVLHTAITSARLKKRLMKGALAPPEEWQHIAEKIQSELGIRGKIKLIMLRDLASPALSASLRPTVAMPLQMLWQEKAQAEFALRHELMHLKRKDHLVCLLLMLLKAVYWFNPVVWIMAAMMKRDMETACDSMVVQPMSKAEKKQYAATIIDMYAQEPSRFVLGMALGGPKQSAERRVRGIFMRSRSSLGVRMSAFLLTGIMLMACFTTACQPVLEEKVATENSKAEIEQAIEKTPAPTEAVIASAVSTQQIDRVGQWQEDYSLPNLKCEIDAQIIWPETNVFPVYKVKKREFEVAFVGKIVDYLTDGATGVRESSDTKEELEEYINCIKNLDSYEGQKEELATLEEKLANVTDEVFYPVTGDTLTLPVNNTYMMANGSRKYIRTEAQSIYMYSGAYESVQLESYVLDGSAIPGLPKGTTIDVKISEQEALETANTLLSDLGIENFDISKTEKALIAKDFTYEITSQGWQIILSRNNGNSVPVFIDSSVRTGLLDFLPEVYSEVWRQETITIFIDETGVRSFEWEYPLEVIEELKSDVIIMPFEETKDKIKQNIESGITQREERSDYINDYPMAIHKIVLSNVLVPIADDPDHQILTPAWLIYYDVELGMAIDTNVFAIDATDGSSINISMSKRMLEAASES